MNARLLLVACLVGGFVVTGCRKRRTLEVPPPPPPPATSATEPTAAPAPPTPATTSAPAPAKMNQQQLEEEMAELNNVIASFESFHKRMPTLADLKKAYYGGTRPLPIPPGHKLVIDPKSKTAQLVPGN